ncbi:hypothetical protein NHH03_21025 [Stieleria sp. TO1_6]|uniref:hypothetical protein n=1 Tax=Stieleria tagensis TaxID=2956795 RepID=UPI00209AFE41|nr:hypothetical protein [Stieleria tagensis]MCO8124239.1 hypothetical protein [Stieleria tagensis]
MNAPSNPSEPADNRDALRQRCLDYLLGDMTAGEIQTFESHLGDPAVSDALQRESQLLLELSTSAPTPRAPSALPCPADEPHRSHRHSRSAALWAAALAATVLVAIGYGWSISRPAGMMAQSDDAQPVTPAFELQLARTWVHPAIDWDATQNDSIETLVDSDDHVVLPDENESDGSLDWMVVAVEAAFQGADTHDG